MGHEAGLRSELRLLSNSQKQNELCQGGKEAKKKKEFAVGGGRELCVSLALFLL